MQTLCNSTYYTLTVLVVEGAATAKGIDARPTTPLCKCFVFVSLALWLSLKVRFSFGRKIIATCKFTCQPLCENPHLIYFPMRNMEVISKNYVTVDNNNIPEVRVVDANVT